MARITGRPRSHGLALLRSARLERLMGKLLIAVVAVSVLGALAFKALQADPAPVSAAPTIEEAANRAARAYGAAKRIEGEQNQRLDNAAAVGE